MPDTRLRPWTRTQERLASPVIRLMTLLNVWAYRLSGGRLGGTFLRGAPVCLVTARGRRSSLVGRCMWSRSRLMRCDA